VVAANRESSAFLFGFLGADTAAELGVCCDATFGDLTVGDEMEGDSSRNVPDALCESSGAAGCGLGSACVSSFATRMAVELALDSMSERD
jgi:hypothetical protein